MKAPLRDLVSIEEAQKLVLERVGRLPDETVPVEAAVGRVLTRTGNGRDRPAAVRQLGDGRVRAARRGHAGDAARAFPDRCGKPRRSARSSRARRWGSRRAASSPTERMPSSRSSMLSIMTTRSSVPEAVARGASITAAGGDLRRGEVVVEAGTRLGAARRSAALAAAGVAEARVSRRPRAAVLATGSELRRPGEPLEPGQIYDANGVLSRRQLASRRGRGRAAEQRRGRRGRPIAARSRAGSRPTCSSPPGGVSVGPHDLVRAGRGRARRRGGLLGRVRQAGEADLVRRADGDRLVFGLPGEPGVGARRLRALRAAGRARAPGREPTRCRASSAGGSAPTSSANPTRDELLRGAPRCSRRGRRCSSRFPAGSRT